MKVMFLLVRSSKRSGESQKEETEHVVRGEERRDGPHEPDDAIEVQRQVRRGERRNEDLVLREESGKRREARDGDRRDQKRRRT